MLPMNWNSPIHPKFLTTDGRRLPANYIFCVAKNYKNHAEEMGGEGDREGPFHFQKSFGALTSGLEVRYRFNNSELYYTVELVALIGVAGQNLGFNEAEAVIFGYVVGLDSTSHDRQAEANGIGRPSMMLPRWVSPPKNQTLD